MLFHSPAFIFGFLPLCFLGFLCVHRLWGWQAALLWLAGASLVFYGQWSLALAGLLLGSILFNYGAARLLLARVESRRTAFRLLLGAIAVNLGLLGYFKYTNFFIDNVNLVAGTSFSHLSIILPIGISFYTFIQIGFLVEVYNRQVGAIRFGHYLLFASFFPCVTAGPIAAPAAAPSNTPSAKGAMWSASTSFLNRPMPNTVSATAMRVLSKPAGCPLASCGSMSFCRTIGPAVTQGKNEANSR